MRSHTTISPEEAADRLALRELFDAYARCADRRDAQGQLALFTEDIRFVVYMDAKAADPTQELHGRDALASIRYLDQFVKLDGTWHFAERKLLVDWTDTRPLLG
jgi:hypothetical protein